MELLPYYQKLLDNEKTVVFMQVGDFFEIYGLVYPDGREVGNLWKIIDDLHLKIASKSQSVYDFVKETNPDIQPITLSEISDVNMATDCTMDTTKMNKVIDDSTV